MNILSSLFIWWNKQTISTKIYTYFRGKFVGVDDLGNKYYTSFDKKRRWVIYENENYASELSIEWHGWLHWTTNSIPLKMSKSINIMNKVFVPMDRNLSNSDSMGFRSEQNYEPWVPK